MDVLLVDDEKSTIRMLQTLIDWEELGLNLSGYAENGTQAYEMIRERRPDIVISDIKMPGMDGLELLRRITSCSPETRVIIMSAYADFSFVKEAIKYGSCDYILKPVDEMELVQTLQKTIREIQGERAFKEVIATSEKKLDQMNIYHFMQTGHGLDRAGKAFANSGLELRKYTVFILQENNGTINEYNDANNLEISQEGYILSMLDDILLEFQLKNMVFAYEENSWTIVIDSLYCVKREKVAENIRTRWKERLGTDISICFSTGGSSLEELPVLFEEVRSLSKYSFYIGEEKILGYGYNCNRAELNEVRNIGIMREIELLVHDRDRERLQDVLDEIFVLTPDYNFREVGFVCEICYHMLVLLRNEMGGQKEDCQKLRGITYEDLAGLPSLKALKEKMQQILEQAFEELERGEKKEYSKAVRDSIVYMEEHYDQNISLEEICTQIAVSKNYFCYLFKRETGMNLWNYLTLIRLNQARQLLETTDLRSYEIALQVGYDNPSYFSKLFKKQERMTPNEYRKQAAKARNTEGQEGSNTGK